jgi:hypothetical protein
LAELAGQTRCVEANVVSLHDVNAGTLRRLSSLLRIPAAVLVVELDQVDTGSALAAYCTHIDIKLEGSTEVLVPVRPISGVVEGVVEHEGLVILADTDR